MAADVNQSLEQLCEGLRAEDDISAGWFIENLNPSSVANAEKAELTKLLKDNLRTSLIPDIVTKTEQNKSALKSNKVSN